MSKNQTYRFPFASYPAVRIAILLSVGITLDYIFNIPFNFWLWICSIVLLTYFAAAYLYQRSLLPSGYTLLISSYLGFILAFGGGWHSLYSSTEPIESTVLQAYTWETLAFSGTVKEIHQTSTGKYQLDIEVDSTIFDDKLPWTHAYQLRAVLDPEKVSYPDNLFLGSRIKFRATIYPLEEQRNPHQFAYKNYLASQNIYSQAGVKTIQDVSSKSTSLFSWTDLRRSVLTAIEHNFSPDTAPLAKALLIGHKNQLDRDEKIAFSRAGLSHIMAVSGLHVGFILAPFWVFIPFFWTFRYGKQIGLFLLVVLLLTYAGLTGFSASVTRASLVGGFLLYGRLFHKVSDSKNLTALAALIILLIDPADLFNIGFQLSFSAVYSILFLSPVINRWLPAWIQYRWYGAPIMVVIISIIVQLSLFPLLAFYFGEFSLVGPLANAVVIPFLGIAVPSGLLLLVITPVLPNISTIVNIPIDYFLRYLQQFVEYTSNWSWAWMQAHIDSMLFFIIWATALFTISSIFVPRIRWKMLIVLLAFIVIDQSSDFINKFSTPVMKITVFDVGQGDATLVSTPNGKEFLIDTGVWQPGYNSAAYIILPYLKSSGIEKLDAVFLSHPHADHIGGISELLKHIPIDTIYNSGTSYDSHLYKRYLQQAKRANIPIVSLSAGDHVSLDNAMRIFVYGPLKNTADYNINNRSLVLELIYGDTEFLFMGDAEQIQERRIVNNFPTLIDTDFLKVGHHGSKTSSTVNLLKRATPDISVVSLAKSNRFRHPHPEAIQRISSVSELHFTSLDAAQVFTSDGHHIKKIAWK